MSIRGSPVELLTRAQNFNVINDVFNDNEKPIPKFVFNLNLYLYSLSEFSFA